MSNEWIVDGLPIAGDWTDAEPCAAPGGANSIVDTITITGAPGAITSVQNGQSLWALVLNDGTPQADFRLDRFDDAGALASSPMTIVRASGVITFNDPVMLSEDPVEDMEAATKAYVDTTGLREAPIDNTTYGRDNGTWVPLPGSYMPEAPNTSQRYGRFNSIWQLDAIQTDAPSDGAAYARQNGAWTAAVTGGPYLPLSGGTMTGPLVMQGSNMVALNSPLASGQSAIIGQKAGINRWQMMIGDYTAEGLNNVGSNFSLVAFSTTGATLGTWLTIARADGSTTFTGAGVTIAGGLAVNGLLAITNVGNLSIPGGTNGQVLSTNGSGVLSWATRLSDAPSDGQFYTRQNAAWAIAPGGMTDAPNDGTAYARKSAGWAHLTHTDVTDWTASLAPYALTTAVPVASSTLPAMDGTAAVGTASTWARADHVHPVDTSRYAASNPSGYQTAAQVTASLSSYLPLAGGTLTDALNGTTATFSSTLSGSGQSQVHAIGAGNASFVVFDNANHATGTFGWQSATANALSLTNASTGNGISLDGASAFNILGGTGVATKPGGGNWTAPSDSRIKTVLDDYEPGLDQVLQLHPVIYTYLGNDTPTADVNAMIGGGDASPRVAGPPYPGSPHYRAAETQTPFVGFIAQELETIFPGMVSQNEGFIDGEPVSDLRNIDVSNLIYALVNAVKTLAARVAELEDANG